jgi:RimJ/RimL family protein N-acetyltransferase
MPLKYLYGQDELVADFVARMIPHVGAFGFGKCKAIGVCENNELIAGIVFHSLSPAAGLMELSAAALPGRQWCTRETLRAMYNFCFVQCGCQQVVNKVLASDERHLRELAALGYRLIAIPRLFGRSKDGVIALLTDDDWRANKIFRRINRPVIDLNRLGEAA